MKGADFVGVERDGVALLVAVVGGARHGRRGQAERHDGEAEDRGDRLLRHGRAKREREGRPVKEAQEAERSALASRRL